MAARLAYALAISIIIGVILADTLGYSSFYANAVLLALGGLLLALPGLARNRDLPGWFLIPSSRQPAPRGGIWSMAMKVKSAERGYGHSRDELASLLAGAFTVKSEKLLTPNYDTIMAAREELKRKAGDDPRMKEFFDPPKDQVPSRFRRGKEDGDLSLLESAIKLVEGPN